MTQEDAIRKAMACLRLAKSSNPHEAALAAAKAQEIITAHKLDISGLDYENQQKTEDNEPIMDFSNDPLEVTGDRDRIWSLRLASVIARNNQCRVYYADLSQDGRNKSYRISIVGRPGDVQTVRYVHSYLKSEVMRLINDNTKGNSAGYKQQYGIGVVDAISRKLSSEFASQVAAKRAESAVNPLALVRVNNAVARIEARGSAVEKFMAEKLNLRKGRSGGGATSMNGNAARAAGRRDGANVRFTQARGSVGRGVAGNLS